MKLTYSLNRQWHLGWSIPFFVLVDPYHFDAVKMLWIDKKKGFRLTKTSLTVIYFALCVLSQILTGVLSILISIWLERCFMTFIVSTDCVSVYNTSDLVTFIMPGCKAKQPFLWQESANTYQVWYVLQIMVGFYYLMIQH